ncbi:unnamed protein product [Symbiodinium necroappetens]|uniref:Uncharacterized protein n=1 Tax=Symbiodinium necroappetens TaxID=1628268 RepID=A0A812Y7V6_9DINO|nr:unnamed protein product [Symbiodinium necroappetens]
MIIHTSDFLVAFRALMDSGETATARMEGDVGMARLDAVLKATKRMDLSMNAAAKAAAEMSPELSEEYNAVMFFDCQAFCRAALFNSDLQDIFDLRVHHFTETLTELCAAVGRCTKNYGSQTEESWKYCIKEDASLEEVLSVAAKTIDTIDGKETLRLSDELTEALDAAKTFIDKSFFQHAGLMELIGRAKVVQDTARALRCEGLLSFALQVTSNKQRKLAIVRSQLGDVSGKAVKESLILPQLLEAARAEVK